MNRLLEISGGTVLFAGLLSGCGEPGYQVDLSKPAQIVEVDYEQEHVRQWSGPPCLVQVDGICILQTIYSEDVPDKWEVTLQQCEDGPRKTGSEADCAKTTLEVSEEQFALLSVGHIIVKRDDQIEVIPQ